MKEDPTMRDPLRRRQRGVTLIELLVAVVIVGILGMIAYPSYTSHLVKSRRAQATACGVAPGLASVVQDCADD